MIYQVTLDWGKVAKDKWRAELVQQYMYSKNKRDDRLKIPEMTKT